MQRYKESKEEMKRYLSLPSQQGNIDAINNILYNERYASGHLYQMFKEDIDSFILDQAVEGNLDLNLQHPIIQQFYNKDNIESRDIVTSYDPATFGIEGGGKRRKKRKSRKTKRSARRKRTKRKSRKSRKTKSSVRRKRTKRKKTHKTRKRKRTKRTRKRKTRKTRKRRIKRKKRSKK